MEKKAGNRVKGVGKDKEKRCSDQKPDSAPDAEDILKLVSLPPADFRKEEDIPANAVTDSFSFEVEGERILVDLKRDIVFRCGEASFALTRSGKIVISGKYVVIDSTGLNHIKGGTIKLN